MTNFFFGNGYGRSFSTAGTHNAPNIRSSKYLQRGVRETTVSMASTATDWQTIVLMISTMLKRACIKSRKSI